MTDNIAPTAARQTSLRDFSGTLVLVGAGKMGSAMLEGWLRLGLDLRHIGGLKPQTAPEVMPSLKPLIGPDTLVLSIMAGRTLGFISQALSGAIVRAMPNTP